MAASRGAAVLTVMTLLLPLALGSPTRREKLLPNLLEHLEERFRMAGHVLERDLVAKYGRRESALHDNSTEHILMPTLERMTQLDTAEKRASSVSSSARTVNFPPLPPCLCNIPPGTPSSSIPSCQTETEFSDELHGRAQNLVDDGLLTPTEAVNWVDATAQLSEKFGSNYCPTSGSIDNEDRLLDTLKLTTLVQPNCLGEAGLYSIYVAGLSNSAMMYYFKNSAPHNVKIYYYHTTGWVHDYGTMAPGQLATVYGSYGNTWKFTDPAQSNECVDTFRATVAGQTFQVRRWSSINWW